MNSKGVSEVVGALMVVSLIVATAGLIYVISNPILFSSQENIKYRKAFFDLLELKEKIENVKSGVEANSTYTVRLSGASLAFENRPVLIVDGREIIIASIKISGSGWELWYENGAIIEKYGGRMYHLPKIYYDPQGTLTMDVIQFAGNTSIGGTGYVTLSLKLASVEKKEYSNASVAMISENSEAWKKFFREIGLEVDGSLTFNVSRLLLTIYRVEV
ncbi:MAG: hypothetical protein PWQ22_1688 [Archaeoglobaceae archaeon]|nr:hypothetical protein [Archaeoglobaceae archaeon]